MDGHAVNGGAGARDLSRREALKRGAVVGGALVWSVPAIQVISLTAAQAENPSAAGGQGPPPWANKPGIDGGGRKGKAQG